MSAPQTTQSFLLELGRVPEVDLASGLGRRRFDELVQTGVLVPPAAPPRARWALWVALGVALAVALLAF